MFPKLLTVQEVAKMFRMNTLTVYEYVRTGKLPAVKIGRSYRILEVDLYSFITANKTLRVNNLQEKGSKVNAS